MFNTNTDFEVQSLDINAISVAEKTTHWWDLLKYTAIGMLLGVIFIKGEIISWFRIQEMFRLQSFHMYGVIGSAVAVAAFSVWLIKRFHIKTIHGEPVVFYPKQFNKGQVIGGLIFGFGWALTGACPGPLFGLLGAGVPVAIVMIVCAIAGTWVYGLLRDKLPH
ncbi:transporter [Chitinophaga agrisoli]|uniref:Transporter n=1 Tax=Chitinophaga agrisoli TaxID=2607653 RepID=A0A5B2VYG0_9BACT|nr:DUF6691 family protein [Chitinophaga agrisoli]KAA2243216.1 transporter [Chitinophaga agrisoli]